jgi:ring-1,2-phenylacetyl-CoA epoxidase subunit PaaC
VAGRYRRRPAQSPHWLNTVTLFASVDLPLPKAASHFYLDGRKGLHTEHLGLLLAEMQFLPRAYPDATW